jgi:hypothetical protein
MSKKKHLVDIVTVNLGFLDKSPVTTFDKMLKSEFVNGQSKIVKGKSIEYKLLEDTEVYIVGILITTQDKDIPPKRHKKTGEFNALDVTAEEGLAFANVFLFEKNHSILMYEINKNGCYLDQFKEFLFKCWVAQTETDYIKIDIKFAAVLKLNEYERAVKMRYYKSVEVVIAEPKEVLQLFEDENDSIENNSVLSNVKSQLVEGVANNSSIIVLKHSVYTGQPFGLSHSRVVEFISAIRDKILKSNKRKNVQKLVVVGYSEDMDIKRQEPIDLMGDVFKTSFSLYEPRINTDVQMLSRKGEIKELYNKHQSDFKAIFGK